MNTQSLSWLETGTDQWEAVLGDGEHFTVASSPHGYSLTVRSAKHQQSVLLRVYETPEAAQQAAARHIGAL